MAAKKSPIAPIADIEKQITKLNSELQRARMQKLADAEKALATAKAGLTAIETKVDNLAAAKKAGAGDKTRLLNAKAEKARQEVLIAKAKAEVEAAKTALQIAAETAKLVTANLAKADKPRKKAAKKAAKEAAASTAKVKKTADRSTKTDKVVDKKKAGSKTTGETMPAAKKVAKASPTKKAAATPVDKPAAETAKKPASPRKKSAASKAPLPKPAPVTPEVIPTSLTAVPPGESSLLPGHASTSLIEPREQVLPKPTPVN